MIDLWILSRNYDNSNMVYLISPFEHKSLSTRFRPTRKKDIQTRFFADSELNRKKEIMIFIKKTGLPKYVIILEVLFCKFM